MPGNDYPLIKTHTFVIDNFTYKASAIFYSDTVQLFVTFDGKIGNLVQSSYNFGCYDCKTLLGDRSQEFKALCRCLIERYKDFASIKSPLETELYLLLCIKLHENTEYSNKLILKELSTFFTTPNV